LRETNRPFYEISLFTKRSVSHVSLYLIRNKTARFAKFFTFELPKWTSSIVEPILCSTDRDLKVSVTEPHHVDAAPGKKNDAAPAPAPPYYILCQLFKTNKS
jgi:hypothetical protein